MFSYCFIDRLKAEFLRGKSLNSAEIGIVGLGSIGRSLADLASNQGNSVTFYDPAPDLKVPHYLRGRITRAASLEELMLRSDYVFGSSGRNPFEGKWPMAHRPGVKLFSGSGGDQEFGPIIRYLRERPSFKIARHTLDITSEDGPSGPIRIAYMGFPYNFVSRAESAVPTPIVQLETAGLLSGMIQARSYLELVEEGHEPDARIHRVSPEAQAFIYDMWLRAMENRGIDIRDLYGYDTSLLAATQRNGWLANNTEPRFDAGNESGDRVEERMRSILAACCRPER